MRVPTGCLLENEILVTTTRLLAFGRLTDDETPVLVKALKSESAASEEMVASLWQEFRMSESLPLPCILHPLFIDPRLPAIVFEKPEGELLAFCRPPLELPLFLKLAQSLTLALAELHAFGAVHGRISPQSVFFDASTARTKLFNLEFASTTPGQTRSATLVEPENLAFLAPEQTGYLQTPLSPATDLYALGALFFWLLTGRPPFSGNDTLETIHGVMTAPFPDPRTLNTEIPDPLAEMILRLTRKEPRLRLTDTSHLQTVLKSLEDEAQGHNLTGRIAREGKLAEGRHLHGRETVVATLVDWLLEPPRDKGAAVVLMGKPGVGKSRVLEECMNRARAQGARVVIVKAEEAHAATPFGVVKALFRQIVRGILPRFLGAEAQTLRALLHQALGPNVPYFCRLVPEAEMLFHGQESSAEEPALNDSDFRVQHALSSFLGEILRLEGRILLVVDDLQWADPASQRTLVGLLENGRQYRLSLFGTGRPELAQPPSSTLERLSTRCRELEVAFHHLELEELDAFQTRALVSELLETSKEAVEDLSRFIYAATFGNPFFARQALTALIAEGFLLFDSSTSSWKWKRALIKERLEARELSDFIMRTLSVLPRESLEVLGYLACQGEPVTGSELGAMVALRRQELDTAMARLINLGIVSLKDDTFEIRHDRIREAAYAQLPPATRQSLHLRIARHWAGAPEESRRDRIFEALRHFSLALPAIVDAAEAKRVARMALDGARVAQATAAHQTSLALAGLARRALKLVVSEDHTDLAIAVALQEAESLFFLKRTEEAKSLLDELEGTTPALEHEVKRGRILLEIHTIRQEIDEGIAVGTALLHKLGLDFSLDVRSETLNALEAEVERRFTPSGCESFLAMPSLKDFRSQAVSEILFAMTPLLFHKSFGLIKYASLWIARMGADEGTSPTITVALAHVAFMSVLEGKLEFGSRISDLTLLLDSRDSLSSIRARISNMMGLAKIGSTSLRSGVRLFYQGIDASRFTGDVLWASYNIVNLLATLWSAGERLSIVLDECLRLRPHLQSLGFDSYLVSLDAVRQAARNLMGATRSFGEFEDAEFHEREEEELIAAKWAGQLPDYWYSALRLQAAFWAERWPEALAFAARIRSSEMGISSFFHLFPDYVLFASLSFCEILHGSSGEHSQDQALELERLEAKMEALASTFPAQKTRALLLRAGRERVSRKPFEALRLVDAAADAATEEELPHLRILAHEMARRICTEEGMRTSAEMHGKKALDCCDAWGATALANHIHSKMAPTPRGSGRACSASDEAIARMPAVHAARDLSREVEAERLVPALMQALMRYSGASRAGVFLEREGRVALAATGETTGSGTEIRDLTAGEGLKSSLFPLSLVNYVAATKSQFLLQRPEDLLPFLSDPFFLQRTPASIICRPLLQQRGTLGVVYLENSEAEHVFDGRRQEILEIIAGQAAISLENARLYAQVRNGGEMMNSVVSRMVDAVVVCNARNRITLANEAARKIFRPPVGTAGNIGIEQFFSTVWRSADGETLPRDTIPLLRALEGQTVAATIFTVPPRGGEKERYLQINAAPVLGRHGEVIAAVSVTRDLTPLVEMDRLKDQFLRVVSHELKTPVAIMKGFSQVLLRSSQNLDARTQGLLAAIDRGANDLTNIIGALIDSTILQLGQMKIQRQNLDLLELVRELVSDFDLSTSKCTIALRRAENVTVSVDASRLRQILRNLLSNAIKFSSEGGRVDVDVFADDMGAQIVVEDYGVGIPQERQARIFDLFFRAHTDTRYDFQGLGLGLFISREIAKLLGGSLGFRSAEGEGSAFQVTLPLNDRSDS